MGRGHEIGWIDALIGGERMAGQIFLAAVEVGPPRHDDARDRALFRDRDPGPLLGLGIRRGYRNPEGQSGRNGTRSDFPAHGSLTMIPLQPSLAVPRASATSGSSQATDACSRARKLLVSGRVPRCASFAGYGGVEFVGSLA